MLIIVYSLLFFPDHLFLNILSEWNIYECSSLQASSLSPETSGPCMWLPKNRTKFSPFLVMEYNNLLGGGGWGRVGFFFSFLLICWNSFVRILLVDKSIKMCKATHLRTPITPPECICLESVCQYQHPALRTKQPSEHLPDSFHHPILTSCDAHL